MPQNDFVIANQTFPATRSDINSALQALASISSGATAPSTTYSYMLWADTTTGLLKIRNAANSAWITIGTLASTNLGLIANSLVVAKGDLIGATSSGVPARVAIGSDGQEILAQSSASPGLAWSDKKDGFRNRVINGSMIIDQRNAGSSVTPTTGQYTLDRWQATLTAASKFSVQQSTTAPTGYFSSLKITSLSAYSVSSSDSFTIQQPIEGNNVVDLSFGSASAKTVTLSFWVRSSLTGTFGGAIKNSAQNRSYPFSYTISSANTWEYKTVVISGDTSGTWLTDSGVGLYLGFNLGSGATFSGTSGTWAGSNYNAPTGAVSVVGTNAATFYITGVQLELGNVATAFERLGYSDALALCERYCLKLSSNSTAQILAAGITASSTVGRYFVRFRRKMRTTPSFTPDTTYSNFAVVLGNASLGGAVTNLTQLDATTDGAQLEATTSGATAGQGSFLVASGATNAFVIFSAEL